MYSIVLVRIRGAVFLRGSREGGTGIVLIFRDEKGNVCKDDQMHSIVLVVITGPVFVRMIKCIVLSW